MSQAAYLRDFDAMAFAALADCGLADAAIYRATITATPVDCTVLVDREVRDFGDDVAPVSTAYTRVIFQRIQVQPVRGGIVAIEGVDYELADRIGEDEAASRWVVQEVRHG